MSFFHVGCYTVGNNKNNLGCFLGKGTLAAYNKQQEQYCSEKDYMAHQLASDLVQANHELFCYMPTDIKFI
jgi:hypothetical protein